MVYLNQNDVKAKNKYLNEHNINSVFRRQKMYNLLVTAI